MTMTGRWTRGVWRQATALTLLAGLAAPVWLDTDVSAQEDLPLTAAAAPESTVLFQSLDLDREGTQWQLTEELLSRVGLPDARALWEEAMLEEGAAGDFTAADLDALLGGEMAIVVTPEAIERSVAKFASHHGGNAMPDAGDATPMAQAGNSGQGLTMILVPGDPEAAWDYVERQVTDLAAKLHVEVEESTYSEAELLAIAPGDRDTTSGTDDADPISKLMAELDLHGHGSLVTGRADDYIIVGSDQADVIEIVDVIDGSAASLADSPEARAVAAELPADALAFTYIDAQRVIDALGPELAGMHEGHASEMPQEVWRGQLGLAISADDAGFRFDTISIPSAGADLESMLVENDPSVATAAERAPADTFAFQAGRLPENAYVGAPYMLAQAVNDAMSGGEQAGRDAMMDVPTAEEMEEAISTAAGTLGFDPATDLFDLLGYDFIAFSSFPSITIEGVGLDALVAVSTTDSDALAETAEKIAALIDRADAGADVSTRSVAGDTVYIVSGPETEGLPAVEFGVVGDQAVIAVGGGIEDLATEPEASLAEDPQYQTVMGLLPDEYYQVGYLDIGQAIESIDLLMSVMGGLEIPAAAAAPSDAPDKLQNIRALGTVAFQRDGMDGSSAILYIAESES
jgi:Protein of unknown function (DUF3352)